MLYTIAEDGASGSRNRHHLPSVLGPPGTTTSRALVAAIAAFAAALLACGSAQPWVDPHSSTSSLLRVAPQAVAGGGSHYNVFPMGDAAFDVPNVQWAIDNVVPGGVVELKGHDKWTGEPLAFKFGPTGSVGATKSVSIVGEVDDAGTPLAMVHGGYMPITCDDPTVALAVSNLRFDGAKRMAIHVRQSASAKIAGNVIVNVIPSKEVGYPNPTSISSPPAQFNPSAYFMASGVEMGLLRCEHPDPLPPNACTDKVQLGTVDISSNYIDLGIYDAEGNLLDPTKVYPNARADGTPLEDTSFSGILLVAGEVTATISGNTVRNTTRRAIHPLDTFGSTEIVGNTVVMAPFSSAAPGLTSVNGAGKRNYGIFPLNGNRNVEAATEGAAHRIVDNTVHLASDSSVVDGPHGNGIILMNGLKDAVISRNTVVYQTTGNGAREGILVAGNSSSVRFAKPIGTIIDHNTIDASSHPLDPSTAPAHILVYLANSTTLDANTYVGPLPTYVIEGLGTNVVDASHPNTVVDAYCGTSKIAFANLASCTQP